MPSNPPRHGPHGRQRLPGTPFGAIRQRPRTFFAGGPGWLLAFSIEMTRRLILGLVVSGVLVTMLPPLLRAQTTTDTPSGNDSAYTALRVVGKVLGRDTLDRVMEVTGRDGKPQPYLWKVVLQEPAGGTREVDVAGGKIAAQRMDAKPPASKEVIHLQDLNLDSSGAFDATDAQARKVHLRFDSVNYALRPSDVSGKPQWSLDLLNQDGADVGAMRLGANDGNIAAIDGRLATGPAPTATPRPVAAVQTSSRDEESTPRPHVIERTVTTTHIREAATPTPRVVETHTTTTVVNAPPPPPVASTEPATAQPVPDAREEGGLFTRAGRTIDKTNHAVAQTVDNTNHAVGQGLRKAGATVQRFFTGHSDFDQDAPPRAPNDNRD